MDARFGETLKRLRLNAGVGLRKFADMIDEPPSNLSAMEHGRRGAPVDPVRLREIAETLGLVEGSDDWNEYFDTARREGDLPADVRHVAGRDLVPALLRTIDNRQLTDEEIARLIADINSRHGGRADGDTEPPAYVVPEIERLARELLGQHFGSDIVVPVDVDLLVERIDGVDLDYWPGLRANHGIEGMIARDPPTGRLFVFIDDKLADTKPTRYRMTVAEELSHLVLHRKMIDQVHSPDDFKELQRHYRWHIMERNAKRFAATILMPGHIVTAHAERLYPQLVTVAGFGNAPAIVRQLAVTLARQFEVSTQTMDYRLDEWPMRIKNRVEESVRDHVDFLV